MFNVEKTNNSSQVMRIGLITSEITSKAIEMVFNKAEKITKDGYALLGLDIKINPPKKLLSHIKDTVNQNILEDSSKQVKIAQGYKGSPWCAYTVSYFLRENGVKIPVMSAVSQYVDWGIKNGRYKKLKVAELTKTNYKAQVKERENQVKSQMASIKEGDLIIWKSNSLVVSGKHVATKPASHIGIVTKKLAGGKIVVAEGNANIYETKTVNGVQGVSTGRKTNGADRLMEKTYDAHALAVNGYSGYIAMEGLCN